MKLDADQENALAQAAEVALDHRKQLNRGADLTVPEGWDVTVAANVLGWLGHLTPASWAELRRLTEHTRGRLEATATKADQDEDEIPW